MKELRWWIIYASIKSAGARNQSLIYSPRTTRKSQYAFCFVSLQLQHRRWPLLSWKGGRCNNSKEMEQEIFGLLRMLKKPIRNTLEERLHGSLDCWLEVDLSAADTPNMIRAESRHPSEELTIEPGHWWANSIYRREILKKGSSALWGEKSWIKKPDLSLLWWNTQKPRNGQETEVK